MCFLPAKPHSSKNIDLQFILLLYLRYNWQYFLLWYMPVVLKLFSLQCLWKSLLNLRHTRNKTLIKIHIVKVFCMYTIDESMKKNDPDILFDLYICSNKSKALRTFRHVIFLPQ